MNLHSMCHRALILDLPHNINAIVQMGGRVERVGQSEHPVIEILDTDHTFDIAKQDILASKYLEILAGQANFDLSAKGSMMEEVAIRYVCEEVIRRMLGQSCSRLRWKATGDKYSKLLMDGRTDHVHEAADLRLLKARETFTTELAKIQEAEKKVGKGLKVELIEKGEGRQREMDTMRAAKRASSAAVSNDVNDSLTESELLQNPNATYKPKSRLRSTSSSKSTSRSQSKLKEKLPDMDEEDSESDDDDNASRGMDLDPTTTKQPGRKSLFQ